MVELGYWSVHGMEKIDTGGVGGVRVWVWVGVAGDNGMGLGSVHGGDMCRVEGCCIDVLPGRCCQCTYNKKLGNFEL